ncbi:MAG: 3'-5' exonuclease [Muribaculaceae bacterium]|nr:3'-5' exonuclease [Muribaculaceae bacterium]
MKLNLKRPLVIFDVESTGLDITKDRIIEISWIKVYPGGREEQRCLRINPDGVPISPQAQAVHKIPMEELLDKPTFKQVAAELAQVFEGSDIAGFNSNQFDIPMLAEEFLRAGVNFDPAKHRFVDVQTIFHRMEPRDLGAACRFYLGHEMENHHAASADTRTTYEVLLAQLDRYPSLPNDVEQLAKFSSRLKRVDLAARMVYDEQGRVVFNFGKYKGQPVKEVLAKDPSYYDWMMRGDFAENTKQALTRIKLEMKANK